MACNGARGAGAARPQDDHDLRAVLKVKNTFLEFTDSDLPSTPRDGLVRQLTEPAFQRQLSDPCKPIRCGEEISRQTSSCVTGDEYHGASDFLTDDEVPSTGPPSPRSPYSADSWGSLSPDSRTASPSWAEMWMEHGSMSFSPEVMPFAAAPFDSHLLPPEGVQLWGGCAGTNMVTLRGVPEEYSMPTLLAEFCNAGFQKGRDFLSVHLPTSANGVANCGFCIVAFEKATARNEFMGAFQGRGMRYSASAPPVSAVPSMPLEVMLATDAMLRERSGSQEAPREPGAAPRRCPGCSCQAEAGFRFCTQCGASLQGTGAGAGGWSQQPR